MLTEEVLAALGTGTWYWESDTGQVTLDAQAARLLELPFEATQATPAHRPFGEETRQPGGAEVSGADSPSALETTTVPEYTVRSHMHAADYRKFQQAAIRALAYESTQETRARTVTPNGVTIRTLHVRMSPVYRSGETTATGIAGLVQETYRPATDGTAPDETAEPPERTDTEGPPPADGSAAQERDGFLLDAGQALVDTRSTADVLRVATSLALPWRSLEDLGVFLLRGDELELASLGAPSSEEDASSPGELPGRRQMPLDAEHPAAQAVRTRKPVYLSSHEEYLRNYPRSGASYQGRRQSWAFLPLDAGERTLGVWAVAFTQVGDLGPGDRNLLMQVARMLAQSFSRAEAEETERELTAGLQRSLRSARGPEIEGILLAARYVPTGGGIQIGGDWYDIIPLPDGRTALVIGDVQGHDVQAASVMAQLRIALRAYAAEGHSPEAVLNRASRFLCGMNAAGSSEATQPAGPAVTSLPKDESYGGYVANPAEYPAEGRFATCLYLELDPESGTVDIARAGHWEPLLQMPDGLVVPRHTAGGLPLGLDKENEYQTTRMVLEEGETLLLYTDGLLETGGLDVDAGWDRIRGVFEQTWSSGRGDDLEHLADSLLRRVFGSAGTPVSAASATYRTTGRTPSKRDDDMALLLVARERSRVRPKGNWIRRTVLTVSQSGPSEISGARRRLENLLHDWSDEEQTEGAVLLLSEVLANVHMHTEGDATVVIQIGGSRGERLLRIEVTDPSDELPHRKDPGEMGSSGRGLLLLGTLSDRWGVDPKGEGKTVWFEMEEGSEGSGESDWDALTSAWSDEGALA